MTNHPLPDRLPAWFRIPLTSSGRAATVRRLIREQRLNTVCQSASCPNRTECWNSGAATFMILGDVCTRSCGFCGIAKGRPAEADHHEPMRVASVISQLGLTYAVITSVTRDDMPDGGAQMFADTIRAVRASSSSCSVEVLIPDFQGAHSALKTVIDAGPDVLGHNMETIPRLYARIRPRADYRRSLELLSSAASSGVLTKSGIMLGFGETHDEVLAVLHDLRGAGCSILTMGQYLRPGRGQVSVTNYCAPEAFRELRSQALAMGFRHVEAGPRVRSSYHAGQYAARVNTMQNSSTGTIVSTRAYSDENHRYRTHL